MKKQLSLLFFLLFIVTSLFMAVTRSSSDELDDVNKQLNDLTTALNMSVNATKPLEGQLQQMQTQITQIKSQVAAIETDVAQKKKNIDQGYKDLAAKTEILNRAIRNFYIKSYYDSPILIFLSSTDATQLTQILAYQKAAQDQDKVIITNIALSISDLEQKKQQLESEQTRLLATKADLDTQSAKLDTIVQGAKAYQASLNSQIADLSAKQQQLLAAKLGSLNIPLFAYNTQGGCSSDINPYKDPGFGGDKFGVFTYGVPNRVGLNQYGALGRANAGQNSDTILRAYYNFDGYQNIDVNTNIKVNDSNGFNSGNIIWSGGLDDYVKRIYEVPDNWPMEALKAQAIAARSYVLASTNNGNSSICANQNCQVFQTNPKGGNWDSAVSQTAGQVMQQGGQIVKAWFSSTHGGYVHASSDIGWSSTSFTKNAQDASGNINSFSDLQNNAYDKDSPWFYCDWGSRSQYNKTAWLQSSEIADIVNSILLVQHDSSTDSHILQTDKNDPDAWSEDQVKQALSKYQTPFTSISSGSVDVDFGSGKTTRVHFSGDGGSADFDSDVFKKYFNLRAPANIQIVGPLFNIEKR
ncbi:MAG: SpoIID/LytB domain-containing protein [Candidatus Levyibacteriota bacterium]